MPEVSRTEEALHGQLGRAAAERMDVALGIGERVAG